ncbi:uncharacterized protein [Eurosta solidaginis]|uniref:uncharacterized protein n=1 Tax=Eurosta solidaginis TaxID=178769 RepID=UPI003530E3CA
MMIHLLSLALLITLQTVCTMPIDDYESTSTNSLTTELAASTTDTPFTTDKPTLQELDEALTKIANVYMQALFSGTHTTELETELNALEMRLYDLLDSLYKQDRLADYMKYEADVTHQLIIYSLLKKLFGYAKDEN